MNVAIPSGPTVGGGGTFAQTEQAMELEGRAPAVLALRDGLYAACQAYANGVIGHDAYALILSQYGRLLVAVVAKPDVPSDPSAEKQAALSALLVTCISRHDDTRIPQGRNTLLTSAFCRRVLDQSLRHAQTRT